MKPELKDIGLVIAERRFDGRHEGKIVPITIKFGKPFRDEGGEECWYCPYSIATDEGQRIFYGAGIDSVQALKIAMFMVNAELKNLYGHLDITWMKEADLGLS